MFNLSYSKNKNTKYIISPFVHSYYMQKDISEHIPKLKTFCNSVIKDETSIDNKESLLGEIKLGSQLSIKHIDNEIVNYIKNEILEISKTYIELYKYSVSESKISIDSIWIVNQRATDYNPIHIHDNSKSDYGLSGFIHIHLPEVIKRTKNLENLCDINSRGARGCHDGITQLIWNNQGNRSHRKSFIYPGIIECPLKTGLLYVFPSWLDHTVYPFYNSDESRITIAFNVAVCWQ